MTRTPRAIWPKRTKSICWPAIRAEPLDSAVLTAVLTDQTRGILDRKNLSRLPTGGR